MFCMASIDGLGSSAFPTAAGRKNKAASRKDFISTRSVLRLQYSNWTVEDVTLVGGPVYYDCSASTSEKGMAAEVKWLHRVGMRSILSLPCSYDGCVLGVLVVALKSPLERE
jgi:hypothetical protein